MSKTENNKPIENIDLISSGWEEYELLDSGSLQKLERFGAYRIVRFEPEAVWKPALNHQIWEFADAVFTIDKGKNQGIWSKNNSVPNQWTIALKDLTLHLQIKDSRHVGVFPEQIANWLWIEQMIKSADQPINVLNLFGYTGVSTIFAARAGAHVTHVDASKSSLSLARNNLESSGLAHRPVRWIVDDVYKFVKREIRRGNHYDAIIMDPPKFGRGPKGEVWKFEDRIEDLLNECLYLFNEDPLFFILTAYNVNLEPAELGKLTNNAFRKMSGKIQCGHLIQQEKSAGRKINQSIYSRWEKILKR